MQVKKKDGSIEEYQESKIESVVIKASKSAKENVDTETITKVVKYVTNEVKKLDEPILVKDIQKAVENALMKYNLFDTCRHYIEECRKREAFRWEALAVNEEMNVKLNCERNDMANANVDEETFGGCIGEATDVQMKYKALTFMIKKVFSKLHQAFKNYIHDANRWAVGMHNCLSYPIDNITSKAATIKLPKALRVPGSIMSFLQAVLVHLQSQSQDQFGGVSLTHLDWSSVPFIRKSFWKYYFDAVKDFNYYTDGELEMPVPKKGCDKVSIEDPRYTQYEKIYKTALEKTIRETHQACEALLHNANTLQSRSGNQLPFTSMNYGTCTLKEGQILCEELLRAWEEGIGELGLTPIFPCGIFQLMDGVNTKKGEPNYYLFKYALKVLPNRDYPNFANGDWSVDRAGFEKSQHIKQNVLEGLDKEVWWKVARLPFDIQEKLGFHIVDDGKDEITVVGVDVTETVLK